MADQNAFPDKEKENLDEKIDKKINEVLSNIDWNKIDTTVDERLKTVDEKLKGLGLGSEDLLSSEDRKYVNTLPKDYKGKALRYLDIFRENPEVVTEYLQTLKKFGNEKAAKEAGATNILFYPNKIASHVGKNPEQFSEETLQRQVAFDLQGKNTYDIAYREDDQGKRLQKDYYGKTSTKIISGLGETGYDTMRSISGVIAKLIDAVGPDNAKSAVEYIENNLPRADDVTYPNKTKPWDQDSAIQDLTKELSQFGVDIFLGGRLIKYFLGPIVKAAAPGTVKKITERIAKQKPLKTKAGKEVVDSFGNIKYASSIAQKAGAWGAPMAIKYGIGRAITSDEETTTFAEGFGFMPPIDRAKWNNMTKRERAVEGLKRKLIHGAEGTVLIGGLTKALGIAGQTLVGTGKVIGKYGAGPFDKLILNPISGVMKSRKSGLPQLVQGIRDAGGFIGGKVLKIPPYERWAYFNTTQGPLKERILSFIESKILPPLRVRGPYTKEAKQIIQQGEQMVRKYKKDVGLSMSQIDRSLYTLLNKGFSSRIFTASSGAAGRQYWDDVISYLKGELKLDALPKVIRGPSRDIQQIIEKLSKQIRPYVKSEEIKKEIIDGMGKYLTTSYKIFQGSFKPDQAKLNAATAYFVDLIKKQVPKYKNAKPDSKLGQEVSRLASQKVDELLQYGKEGSSPFKRLQAITALVSPDKILRKKQALPKVIEDLMGKIDDPMQIIMDTVTKQAELLSHLFTHKNILKEGLRSGWIVTNPAEFAMKGVQESVARSLVPIVKIARTSNIDIGKIYTPSVAKKSGNYFTTPAIAEAIASDALATDIVLQWGWYKGVMAAKTTAQLSKTVLSLMTQARNFETAMFFSIMQGHVGSNASVMEAMKFVFGDVIGRGKINPIAMRRKLTEWTDVGILDTSIVAGEVEAVIADIAKSKYASTDQLFKALMNNPIFRKATEFYQGSDSVWKAYGYEFTKSQLVSAIPIRGLTVKQARDLGYVVEKGRTVDYKWSDLVSNQFREVFGMKWNPLKIDGVEKTYGDGLKEIAAKYIKDTYPNYNIVPTLVQNWRRLPMGNFIAFRSENIRNIYNTMAYSMREMSSMNPFLRRMGARRMVGLTTTLYGLEEGLRAFTGALTNIDEEWMRKYQRWFSPWYDKTSTLFPVSKMDPETKKFWSLNWTREQPYEGVQDAFAQMNKEMFNPVKDDMSLGKRFFNGFFYNFEEDTPGGLFLLFEPFITPSLLIEAIQDIAPAGWTGGLGRNGVTKEGKVIYDIRNDSVGEILAKMFGHLILDINPATIKNAKQVIDAAEGDLSPSGKQLNTANQITKMVLGLGLEENDPMGGITFEVGKSTGRIIDANNDFRRDTRDTQKLIENPFLLMDEFDNLQTNRYRELSRIYEFVTFLKEGLGLSRYEIFKEFKGRGGFGTKTINMLIDGVFDPANLPPTEVTSMYPKILKRINRTDKYKDNPLKLDDIYDRQELFKIKDKWNRVPLGLTNEQLEEFFLTGEDPRGKPEEAPTDDQSMVVPVEQRPLFARTDTAPKIETLPLFTPQVDRRLVAANNPVVSQTGLTRTENALLSNQEKEIKLRSKGMA